MRFQTHQPLLQTFDTYGSFKVVIRRRKFLTEYQVLHGNRVLSRHSELHSAVVDAKACDAREWTVLGEMVRARP